VGQIRLWPSLEIAETGKETVMESQKLRSVEASQLLEQSRALDDLFSLVYEELRLLASFVRKNEINATLNSTALVHEAWLKLKSSPHLAAIPLPHFKAIAAKAMRQVLVDEARRRNARKRGGAGEAIFFNFDNSVEEIVSCDKELLALDEALKELERLNPRQAQMVECRFFAGLNITETASLLSVSESAVKRDWRAVKAWLAGKMRADMP
jgi:RNA polymerase sigma factor (TIGR02999 family)